MTPDELMARCEDFLIRAINSYHPLIEALSECLEQSEMISDYEATRSDIAAIDKARKTLSFARGEEAP